MIIDSNVVIDLLEPGRPDGRAAARAVGWHAAMSQPLVNLIIVAEVSSRYFTATETEFALERLGLMIDPLDTKIAHQAGLAFREYRRRGGPRMTILPDFLIGAHARCRNVPIITRDRDRFESYFPDLHLIDPRTFDD